MRINETDNWWNSTRVLIRLEPQYSNEYQQQSTYMYTMLSAHINMLISDSGQFWMSELTCIVRIFTWNNKLCKSKRNRTQTIEPGQERRDFT